jgi:hypothetical protein
LNSLSAGERIATFCGDNEERRNNAQVCAKTGLDVTCRIFATKGVRMGRMVLAEFWIGTSFCGSSALFVANYLHGQVDNLSERR